MKNSARFNVNSYFNHEIVFLKAISNLFTAQSEENNKLPKEQNKILKHFFLTFKYNKSIMCQNNNKINISDTKTELQ